MLWSCTQEDDRIYVAPSQQLSPIESQWFLFDLWLSFIMFYQLGKIEAVCSLQGQFGKAVCTEEWAWLQHRHRERYQRTPSNGSVETWFSIFGSEGRLNQQLRCFEPNIQTNVTVFFFSLVYMMIYDDMMIWWYDDMIWIWYTHTYYIYIMICIYVLYIYDTCIIS